jgi:3-deoxy-D-arabino-heptulosonate 7-phosphate (DAHP) synthase
MVPMAKAAIAAGASAIMVETHPNPALALSDNAQQLTPDEATRFVRDVFGSLEEEAGERPVAAAGSAGNGVGVAAG